MAEYENKLGPPHIRLAGLQIWAYIRQFPQSDDYWDGNWINVTVHCGAKGADVWVSGSIIHLPEIKRWIDACENIQATLSREANLECMEPWLSVKLRMRELGQISMEVSITPDLIAQEHRFEFDVDQSYLPELINECRGILAAHPIRNETG